MDNYKSKQTSQTIGMFSASLIIMFASNNAFAIKDTSQTIKPTTYQTLSTSSTYDQITPNIPFDCLYTTDSLVDALTGLYKKLLNNQKRLDPDFEKILNDNLWDLYER